MSAHEEKPNRVWCDGCFDAAHYGHFNALRQSKMLGKQLVIGIHDDAEITRVKGPPINNDKERRTMMEACKWVDEVHFGVPYTTSLNDMVRLNIDYVLHGEDVSVDADGRDSYWEIKAAGKFKLIKRTDGVSTTDIIDRILQRTSTMSSRFTSFTTARKLAQFANDRAPQPTDRIVYVDGGFDLFHAGHVDLLRRARALGDYVIVGIHSDPDVKSRKGAQFPILSMTERALCVLACKYVDDVVLGPPHVPDAVFLKTMKVHAVVVHDAEDAARHSAAEHLDILHTVDTEFPGLSTKSLCQRILDQRELYTSRNEAKTAKDARNFENMKANNIDYSMVREV